MSNALPAQEWTSAVCDACGKLQERRNFCVACGAPFGPAHSSAPAVVAAPPIVPAPFPVGVTIPSGGGQLARRAAIGGRSTVHWVGAHGGAGEDTLTLVVPDSVATGHAWPCLPFAAGEIARAVPAVLVARSNMQGLLAAQRALREWAAGAVEPVELLGVVIIADSPAKLPRELRDVQRLVLGGAPRSWTLPYLPELRLSALDASVSIHPAFAALRRSIETLTRDL